MNSITIKNLESNLLKFLSSKEHFLFGFKRMKKFEKNLEMYMSSKYSRNLLKTPYALTQIIFKTKKAEII